MARENERHIHFYRQSADTKRRRSVGHQILLLDTTILIKIYGHMDCIIKEAIDIEVHPNNMNRIHSLSFSRETLNKC
jgi:hypothetical protein